MLVLIGKTGSGKTTVAEELKKRGYNKVVTYTSRPMRPGEVNGVDYNFVSLEEFDELDRKGKFIETTSYNTVHGVFKYGTAVDSFKAEGSNLIILNPYGVKALKNYKATKDENLYYTVVYLRISDEAARVRLEKRGDNMKEVERRLKTDLIDFKDVNADLEISVENKTPEEIADEIEDAPFV